MKVHEADGTGDGRTDPGNEGTCPVTRAIQPIAVGSQYVGAGVRALGTRQAKVQDRSSVQGTGTGTDQQSTWGMFAHALVRARRGSRGGGLLGCREGVDVSPTDPEFTTIADIYPLRITARGADKADKTVRATVVRRGALNAEDAAIILFQRHSASRFELRPNQKANWVN